jgi:hypothetical protein
MYYTVIVVFLFLFVFVHNVLITMYHIFMYTINVHDNAIGNDIVSTVHVYNFKFTLPVATLYNFNYIIHKEWYK